MNKSYKDLFGSSAIQKPDGLTIKRNGKTVIIPGKKLSDVPSQLQLAQCKEILGSNEPF